MKESVSYDAVNKCYVTRLPLLENPKLVLTQNKGQVKGIYWRMTKVLDLEPDNKKAVSDSFMKLIDLKYIVKFSSLRPELQQKMESKGLNYIPWNRVYKATSASTPCRVVYNASLKTR